MRGTERSLGLCEPCTSARGLRGLNLTCSRGRSCTRPAAIQASHGASQGQQHTVPQRTLARTPEQKLHATAGSEREQALDQVRHQSSSEGASRTVPIPSGVNIPERLYSLLPWGQSVPLASQLGPTPGDATLDDAASVGDGMASALPSSPGPTMRRGWTIRSRTADEPTGTVEQRSVQVDHPTLRLIRQRVVSGSRPGTRNDPFKLGLVVEGGGMRGCVSGGALQALGDLGLRDVFDACYGSSAGAINSTFFLSGQREGVGIYHDHIASEEFIDLKRLLKRRPGLAPALNLDYLLGHVMEEVQPLDWDAVLASPIPLKVVASSLDSLRPVLLEGFTDKFDLVTSLRASATVPEVAGGPVHHRGHRFVDAAVFEAVPFRSAVADGCTHVLVLCTRAAPAGRSILDQALADAMEAAVKRAVMSPQYMKPAWKAELEALMADGLSQDEMLLRSLDDDADELPWFAGSAVYPVYPHPSGSSFSPVCTDVPTLKAGVAEGRRAVLTVARAALGDVLDFSRFQETANIVPLPRRSAAGRAATERLWRRYLADFSHHS